MQELIRLFAKRSPVALNQDNINSFGIQTHPANYQSDRFKSWLSFCKANNVERLRSEMLRFLQGNESIKSIEELGKEWSNIIPSFFALGNQVTKERSYQIIKQANPDSLFTDGKTLFTKQFTAVADTLLSLACLKSLSHKDNIDYQSVIKVMAYTEKCIDLKFQFPAKNIVRYLDKPVLLPSCFDKIDPCGDIKLPDTRFHYLEPNRQHEDEHIKGCISGNCTCHENDDCVKQSKCCAKPRIDLVDLMVVKTYTKCYRAGDISYIKNVLEGEVLSTKHRELNRTEELTESETDIKQFEERYLQAEDKSSLHTEMEDVLKTDKGMDAGLTTNSSFGAEVKVFKFGGGTNSTTNLHSNQSKTITNKEVRDYSKDIIDRATKQLEQKVRKLSSFKRIHETEEKNKHVFDNSKGENINGQYLFVNKVSRAQVYNYGRAAALDLVLPEPAALYKRLFENKFPGIEPKKPDELKVQAKDINSENYKNLITQYGLSDVDAPPEEYINVTLTFSKDTAVDDYKKNGSWQSLGTGTDNGPREFSIPDGYVSESMQANLDGTSVQLSLHNSNCYISFTLAGVPLQYGSSVTTINPNGLPPLEGTQSMSVFYSEVKNYSVQVTVRCKRKEETYVNWQVSVFTKIKEEWDKAMAEYQKAFAQYSEAKNAFDAKEAEAKRERYNKNPFINRETEKAELKRMVISYISCQFFDQFDAMKNRVEPCGHPQMNIREAEQQGMFVQFFEQAFDWNLMTYIFYPYFWQNKCNWGKSLKEEAGDLIFEKFLQAGSCHVLIPIRNAFYDYVQHFINFGEIWGGVGTMPLPGDPHYVSLAQEIKEQNANFNAERSGRIDVVNGDPVITLNGTDEYWDFTLNNISQPNIDADLDREILLNYITYRIVSIAPNPAVTTHDSWLITLDRPYEGITDTGLMWSTGAVYVGTPWEFITPTNLVFLRDKSKCLPCYPLKECKEL